MKRNSTLTYVIGSYIFSTGSIITMNVRSAQEWRGGLYAKKSRHYRCRSCRAFGRDIWRRLSFCVMKARGSCGRIWKGAYEGFMPTRKISPRVSPRHCRGSGIFTCAGSGSHREAGCLRLHSRQRGDTADVQAG